MTTATRDLIRHAPRPREAATRALPVRHHSVVADQESTFDGARPSLAERLVALIPFGAPRFEYEADLDLQGHRCSFLAHDGSEGVEWALTDGSFVQHTEVDGWSTNHEQD